MESLTATAAAAAIASSSPPFVFSPKSLPSRRILRCATSPKNNGNESDVRPEDSTSLVPILSNRALSKDAAMGLVLSAANVRGWTTGSGMEGPPVPADPDSNSGSSSEQISTFPI